MLLWAEPKFLLGQKCIDSKAYKLKYSRAMDLHLSPEHSKWHWEKGGDSSKQALKPPLTAKRRVNTGTKKKQGRFH